MSEDSELLRIIHSCFNAMEVKRDKFGTCLKAWKSKGANLSKVETCLFYNPLFLETHTHTSKCEPEI